MAINYRCMHDTVDHVTADRVTSVCLASSSAACVHGAPLRRGDSACRPRCTAGVVVVVGTSGGQLQLAPHGPTLQRRRGAPSDDVRVAELTDVGDNLYTHSTVLQ